MDDIRALSPQSVFGRFADICAIPHGTGNMDGINKYLVDFAKEHGFEYYTDDAKNVIIIKNATAGYEDEPAIIMQAHVDMVCSAEMGKEIDFETEAIKPYIDGAYVTAEGTTLGADNGIGASMILAVLEDDKLEHPRIEAVFTTDEETTMNGAISLDASVLQGRRMINLDSEEEGIFTVSSAGGARMMTYLPITREKVEGNTFKVVVHGGYGGHSGAEIHQGRSNANSVMGRALRYLSRSMDIRIADIKGGKAHNIIPDYCVATVVADCDYDTFDSKVSELEAVVRNEYHTTDPRISIDAEVAPAVDEALTADSTDKIIGYLFTAISGVRAMSFDMENLVETSINFATVAIEGDEFVTLSSIRSSVESRMDLVIEEAENIAHLYGMRTENGGRYPGWPLAQESELRSTCIAVWTRLFGQMPKVVALHAGLECGIFMKKMPDLDAIAIGPQLYAVHSPEECVEIASVGKNYKFLCEVLKTKPAL